MNKMVLVLVFASVLISGCISKESTQNAAKSACVEECLKMIERGENLSKGPCLSDGNPEWAVKGWVCDVAHLPREKIDDNPENQCQEFRNGSAKHFVEVDENCKIIRAM